MRYLLLLFLILFTKTTFSQVNFEPISFNAALQKARAEQKLIFLQFEADKCGQCNDVAEKGLSQNSLAERINQLFICLKIDTIHADRKTIQLNYNMNKGFGTLFIDFRGNLIYKFGRTTTDHKEYAKQINIALNKASESVRINDLEKEYRNGKRDLDFIENYLFKRKILNLPTDSILEEYITILPPDSLQSVRTIVFIARMSPIPDSKADSAMRNDKLLFSTAWYTIPLPERVNINNAIIYKGMEKAIDSRNEKLASRIAWFASSTHTDPEAGAKSYEMNMLRFYEKSGDTSTYFRNAISYYNRYFMRINVDSLKFKDSMEKRLLLQQQKKDTIIKDGKTLVRASISYRPITQNYARELNRGAWSFYKMTNTRYLLAIATDWIKKALAFFESPETMDTYARLLYKQAQKEKAIEIQTQAIELRKKRGISTSEFEMILERMKNNAASLE